MSTTGSAWLYRQKKSRFWWLGWRVNGKCHFRSTKTSDRKEAEKQRAAVQTLYSAHRAGTLEAVYQALSGKVIPKITFKTAVEQWLEEVNAGTRERYASIAAELGNFIGANDNAPLISEITTEQVREYLMARRKKCSASTTNLERKILSVFFRRCIKNQQLRDNPVFPIRPFMAKDGEVQNKRRAFTLAELRLMYRKAPSPFWRYMIVGGTYTGLRMGDLITLSWPSVDFAENMLHVKAAKTRNTTEKTVHVPIAAPLRAELDQLYREAGRPKIGHVWPNEAEQYKAKGAGSFSNEFYDEILTPCGFVTVRENKKGSGKGREAERALNSVSFHSFRHSFVTLLKATGGSQIVAKELAGHSSDLISDTYTSLPPEVLTKAIDALPKLEDGK